MKTKPPLFCIYFYLGTDDDDCINLNTHSDSAVSSSVGTKYLAFEKNCKNKMEDQLI